MTVGLILFLTLMQAQPTFDVASVKPSAPIKTDTYNINLGKTNHGELTMGNVTLSECLKFAYGFTDDIQLDGPAWIKRKGEFIYDIVAKAPADTPREQLQLMLQGLLTERFKLVMHHEQRQASYLALVEGKKGLKIEKVDEEMIVLGSTNRPGHIESKGAYLSAVATLLSRFMRQPVLDMTGLKGRYAIKLEWTPDLVDPLKETEAPGATAPTIFTAVQQQLGLKLEARKGMLDVIVIDSAERVPVSN